MQLADAIRGWAGANRASIDDSKLRAARRVFEAIEGSGYGRIDLSALTKSEARAVLGLFAEHDRAEAASILNAARRWGLQQEPAEAPAERPRPTLRARPPIAPPGPEASHPTAAVEEVAAPVAVTTRDPAARSTPLGKIAAFGAAAVLAVTLVASNLNDDGGLDVQTVDPTPVPEVAADVAPSATPEPPPTPEPLPTPTADPVADQPIAELGATQEARSALAQLAAASGASAATPYDRDAYDVGWIDEDGDCLNTRHEVLAAESLVEPIIEDCRVVGGEWRDWITGEPILTPDMATIDHVVALAHAHRVGAWGWSPETKIAFANDLGEPATLNVASLTTNQAKADLSPDEWRPADRAAWCGYAISWIRVKTRWGLPVSSTERTALEEMLDSCGTEIAIGLASDFADRPVSPAVISQAAPATATVVVTATATAVAVPAQAPSPVPTPPPTPVPTSVPTTAPTVAPPSPTPVPPPTAAPAPTADCDPNYVPCVPRVTHDLDCPDIGFAVQVVGVDRHRFDGDGDGLGCESYG